MELDEKLTGREALDKVAQEKGFGKPSREQELLKQKEEMEARHAKADAESAQRDADWKSKYVNKLKEGFLDFLKDKTKIPMKDRNLPDSNRDSIVFDPRGRGTDKVDLKSPLSPPKEKGEERVAPYIDRRTDAQHERDLKRKNRDTAPKDSRFEYKPDWTF